MNDRILAAQSLRKQVKRLARHLDGIRRGDGIESVHRGRVAVRRLDALLDMYGDCWKRKRTKAWKKQIRRLTGDLSAARDDDVRIAFLIDRLASVSDPALTPGIARLLNHVVQRRRQLQPPVLKAIDRAERSGLLKEMKSAARRLLKKEEKAPAAANDADGDRAERCVRKRLKKMLDEAPGLDHPEQHQRHHAMRIAAKRLRYTLELAQPRYNRALDEFSDIVRRLQTLLGEVHDCDVWAAELQQCAFMEARQVQFYFGHSQRFERFRPGIEHLRNDRKNRREQVFGELVALWQSLLNEGAWDRLISIIEWNGAAATFSNEARPAETGAIEAAEISARS